MLSSLKSFLQRLIKRYEGGYVWDKSDPGGPTKYGVTWRVLAQHRGQTPTTEAEWAPIVKAMSLDEAIAIYEKKYAPPIRYNELPLGIDTTMMDYGVNSGYGRANRVARRIVGLTDSTSTSDELVQRIKRMPANDFINAMCDERLRFMQSLKGGAMWKRYGKGWGDRVADLRSYSVALAAGKIVPTAPDLSTTPTPKAEVPKPGKTVETTSSGLGSAIATVLGYLADLPWFYIGGAVVVVIAIGFTIAVVRDIQAAKADAKVHI